MNETLSRILERRREQWNARLLVADSPARAVEMLQSELAALSDAEGEYLSQLTPLRASVATRMLSMISLSLGTAPALSAGGEGSGAAPPAAAPPHGRGREMLSGALGGAAAGAIAAHTDLGAAGSLVAGLAAGLVLALGVSTLLPRETQAVPRPQGARGFEIDPDEILSVLGRAFAAVDAVVAIYGGEPEPVRRPDLSDHRELLGYLQDLLGDALEEQALLPELTRRRLQQLPQLLRRHDVDCKTFQSLSGDSPSRGDRLLFEFEPSLDPQSDSYVMLKPALVRGEQVLLRGRVIEPRHTSA